MDNDYVDNILAIAGPFDHALELGPAIVRCRGSGLDELDTTAMRRALRHTRAWAR